MTSRYSHGIRNAIFIAFLANFYSRETLGSATRRCASYFPQTAVLAPSDHGPFYRWLLHRIGVVARANCFCDDATPPRRLAASTGGSWRPGNPHPSGPRSRGRSDDDPILESGSSATSFALEPTYSCNAGDRANNLRFLVNESDTLEREIYSDAANPREVNGKLPKQLTNLIGIKRLANNRNKPVVTKFAGHPLDVMTQMSHTRGIIEADSRRKRSVWHLYNMILCATGCDPLLYKGYGCYCGFLGSSHAVDGIDSCCKMHDRCYISARCPTFLEYFIPYKWVCYFRQPLCGFPHRSVQREEHCAQKLCECDRELALCLRRFPCPQHKALCTSSPWRLFQNVLAS